MPVAIGQVAGIYTQDTVVPYGQPATLKLVVEGADGPFQMTFQRNADYPETKIGIPSTPFSWGEEITMTTRFTLLDVKNGSNKRITIDPQHESVTVRLAGIGVEEFGSLFAVYPNPTKNILNVDGVEVMAGSKFEISDLLGRRYIIGDFNSQQIDVSDLTRGIYILCISNEEGATRATFLKE